MFLCTNLQLFFFNICYQISSNFLFTGGILFFPDIGSESTKIFHALCYFLEHVTFFSAQEMAAKNKGDLDESIYFTPREQEKFNRFEHILAV